MCILQVFMIVLQLLFSQTHFGNTQVTCAKRRGRVSEFLAVQDISRTQEVLVPDKNHIIGMRNLISMASLCHCQGSRQVLFVIKWMESESERERE